MKPVRVVNLHSILQYFLGILILISSEHPLISLIGQNDYYQESFNHRGTSYTYYCHKHINLYKHHI